MLKAPPRGTCMSLPLEKVTYSGARPVRVRVYMAMHVSQMRAASAMYCASCLCPSCAPKASMAGAKHASWSILLGVGVGVGVGVGSGLGIGLG